VTVERSQRPGSILAGTDDDEPGRVCALSTDREAEAPARPYRRDRRRGRDASLLAIAYNEQGDEARASAAAAEVWRRFPDLKARTLSARECVAEAWCQFLQTQYLPAWRKAGLP